MMLDVLLMVIIACSIRMLLTLAHVNNRYRRRM